MPFNLEVPVCRGVPRDYVDPRDFLAEPESRFVPGALAEGIVCTARTLCHEGEDRARERYWCRRAMGAPESEEYIAAPCRVTAAPT